MQTNLEIAGALKRTGEGAADWYYGGGGSAWASVAAAIAGVPIPVRPNKIVGVNDGNGLVEYCWVNGTTDGDLKIKTAIKRIKHVCDGSEGKSYAFAAIAGLDVSRIYNILRSGMAAADIIESGVATAATPLYTKATATVDYGVGNELAAGEIITIIYF